MIPIPDVRRGYPHQGIPIDTASLWADMPEWWLWYAIDADGKGSYYTGKPEPAAHYWALRDGGAIYGPTHILANTDWRTCLWERENDPAP